MKLINILDKVIVKIVLIGILVIFIVFGFGI